MTAIENSAVGAVDQPDTTAMNALAASTIGYAMDGFDLLILGFILRAISAELHLTPAQAGSLVTWTLIGAVVGGILFRLFGILPGLESIAISLRDVVSAFTGSILFLVGLWFWQKRGA